MSFGAWGERQKSDWKPGSPTETFSTTNGFTGHDQLDNHNLIHMGGRVYDPGLGRFLSADIYIQSPYNTQSYNRYSYTFNNPLSYTDPTGYHSGAFEYLMDRSYYQSSSWSWSTTVSYVNTTRWEGWRVVNPDGSRDGYMTWTDTSTANSVSASSILQAQASYLDNAFKCMGSCHGNPNVTTNFLPREQQQLLALQFGGATALGVLGAACGASVICGAVVGAGAFGASGDPTDLVGGGVTKSIATPYGIANQSTDALSLAARTSVASGATLYRIGTTGKSQAAEGQFWSMINPSSKGYAQKYGIPQANVTNANFIETATLKSGASFITRPAPGLGLNQGGGIEVVVLVGGIQLRAFNYGGL